MRLPIPTFLKSRFIYTSLCVLLLLVASGMVLLLVIPSERYVDSFRTLTDLEVFARQHEEYPEMSNKNYSRPDYTSFLRSDLPGWWSKKIDALFHFLHFRRWGTWSADFFVSLLRCVTERQEKEGYKDPALLKVRVKPGDKFVIWGDLQGAYHSFVRDLQQLFDLDIIDEDLQLKKTNYYLVFLGNVVGRSPFIMPTLSIILRLMERNPSRVVYLAGDLEVKNHWQHFGFEHELVVRATHLSGEKIPLASELNRFFVTLPHALYLQTHGHGTWEFVRMSYMGRNKKEIVDEKNYVIPLLSKGSVEPTLLPAYDKKSLLSKIKVLIRALILSDKKQIKYDFFDGLRILPPDKGVMTWSVLSCPTLPYQKMVHFFSDTFVELDVGTELKDWTIKVYAQDARKKNGFESKTYNFLLGTEIEVTKEEAAEEKRGEAIRVVAALVNGQGVIRPEEVVVEHLDEK